MQRYSCIAAGISKGHSLTDSFIFSICSLVIQSPPLCHLCTLRPREQHWAQLSAFLLNFISALSAATCYLSRARMTGPLSSADRANLITGQRGRGRVEKGGEEREQQLLTVDSHSSVNTRYEVLTYQHRLYEKCMTSRPELTSEADRQTSRGSVSELSKCMWVCVRVCVWVWLWSPGEVKPHWPTYPCMILHYSESNTKKEAETWATITLSLAQLLSPPIPNSLHVLMNSA